MTDGVIFAQLAYYFIETEEDAKLVKAARVCAREALNERAKDVDFRNERYAKALDQKAVDIASMVITGKDLLGRLREGRIAA